MFALAVLFGVGAFVPAAAFDQVQSEAMASDIARHVVVPGVTWTMLDPAQEATYLEGTDVVVMRDRYRRRWLVANGSASQSCIAHAHAGDLAGVEIGEFWSERRGVGTFRMRSASPFARAMEAFASLASETDTGTTLSDSPLFGHGCELRAASRLVFATWRGRNVNSGFGDTLHSFAVVTATRSHALRVVFGAPRSATEFRSIAEQAVIKLNAGALRQVAFLGHSSIWSGANEMGFCALSDGVLTCCTLKPNSDAAAFAASLDETLRESLFGPSMNFSSHTEYVASMFRAAARPEWTSWGALSLCRH